MSAKLIDRVVAGGLTLILHLLIVIVALMPPGNYFFPFFSGFGDEDHASSDNRSSQPAGIVADSDRYPDSEERQENTDTAIPYLWDQVVPAGSTASAPRGAGRGTLIRAAQKSSSRSLFMQKRPLELQPPSITQSTMVAKPKLSILERMSEVDDSYLLTDVFAEAVAAEAGWKEYIERMESLFLVELREDILDGQLDMAFSYYLIHAEYFQLSRALIENGQKPAFTLEEALMTYRLRLQYIAEGLPEKLSGYGLIMLLQRYAENKYYPENGSGMLLDALFHNLNDCEGGTKEILAYLDELYPDLQLGSNRGMVQTSTGEFIGHMQVYLGSDPVTRGVIENDNGVVVETTRIGLDSILPYRSGEVYPLEDFVFYYYPGIILGTPLEELYFGGGDGPPGSMDIVGTSNHPLKKSYSGTSTLLSSHSYDLSNIRSRRIENEFQRSEIEVCDPRIDPVNVDSGNLFANFVAIDGKLRRDLVHHYLADMAFLDNQVMPQWKSFNYLPGYDDLVQTLEEADRAGGYIEADPLHAVEINRFSKHAEFIKYIKSMAGAEQSYIGKGANTCSSRTVLGRELLEYLFMEPESPGLFFLPSPGGVNWRGFLADVQNDCLAVANDDAALQLLQEIESAAQEKQSSLRSVLLQRLESRGGSGDSVRQGVDRRVSVLRDLLRGAPGSGAEIFGSRASGLSSSFAPGVPETFQENGRTGINPGLLRDLHDFLDKTELRKLVADYVVRKDLELTVDRAVHFVKVVSSLTGESRRSAESGSERFSWLAGRELDETIELALLVDRHERLSDTAAASAELADFLENMSEIRAVDIDSLLSYGLTREDAGAAVRSRLSRSLEAVFAGNSPEISVLTELAELKQAADDLEDAAGIRFFHDGLYEGLIQTFEDVAAGRDEAALDYGVLLTAMYLFVTGEQFEDPEKARGFLDSFVRFGAKSVLAKLMVGLVDDVFTPESYIFSLQQVMDEQSARLNSLAAADYRVAQDGGALINEELARGNILARLLLDLPPETSRDLAGKAPADYSAASLWPGRWYLENLHRQTAVVLNEEIAATAQNTKSSGTAAKRMGDLFFTDFYGNSGVREAFSLLSYVQDREDSFVVKFRKMRDLRSIKDPSKVKVVKADRRVTRQDMSLLTLALNPANDPVRIRRSWENTLGVINSHLDYSPFTPDFKNYLFAPNWPYLAENDHGFFYAPEAVEDLHNAESWGGKNDILLSSFLHFRNLPVELPDWLLRTAIGRSEFERKVFERFSQLSFLPMILECTDDYRELPEPLFQAKWITRKPFGEDIFPATLLLLRLGYMDINENGRLVITEKGMGGA